MFIIFGTKGFQEDMRNTRIVRECQHCHNSVQYRMVKYGSKFSLFFIGIFPISTKYRVFCPICNYGFDIAKEDVEGLLDQDNQPE